MLEAINQGMREHKAHIRLLRSLGRAIVTYRAPCCGIELEGMTATEGDIWNTGATCPQCGGKYYKVSTESAIVASLTQARWGIA